MERAKSRRISSFFQTKKEDDVNDAPVNYTNIENILSTHNDTTDNPSLSIFNYSCIVEQQSAIEDSLQTDITSSPVVDSDFFIIHSSQKGDKSNEAFLIVANITELSYTNNPQTATVDIPTTQSINSNLLNYVVEECTAYIAGDVSHPFLLIPKDTETVSNTRWLIDHSYAIFAKHHDESFIKTSVERPAKVGLIKAVCKFCSNINVGYKIMRTCLLLLNISLY